MENYPVPENKWLYIFGLFGLLLVIAGTNLPYWAKFFVFVLFSYVLGRLSARYKKKYSEDVIRNGILGAMGVFAIMFVVGALVPHMSTLDVHLMLGSFIGVIVANTVSGNIRTQIASDKVIIFFAKHNNIGPFVVAKDILKNIEKSIKAVSVITKKEE